MMLPTFAVLVCCVPEPVAIIAFRSQQATSAVVMRQSGQPRECRLHGSIVGGGVYWSPGPDARLRAGRALTPGHAAPLPAIPRRAILASNVAMTRGWNAKD